MVPREHWNERMDLGAFVEPRRYSVPTILLRDEGWSLEDPRVQALLEKIRNTGIPLKDYCKGGIYRGPVTGLNEAFFLDAATRDRLIEEDKRSAEVIKPLLRGRDIDRWRPRKSEMCLIFARRGIEIDRYPAIKRHLSQFREKLAPRPADWDDHQGKWPGRAPGDYQWYELQASPGEDAVEATFKPKTVFQEMAWFNRFALDSSGAVLGNTAYLFADTRSSIAAVLNSPLAWWYMWRTAQHGKDEVLRLIGSYVTEFPVPPDTTGRLLSAAEPMVADLATLAERLFDHENSVLSGLQEKFGISQIDLRVMAWLGLDEEAFAGRVARLSESKRPTAKALQELGAFQQKARARQIEVLTRQLELERRLAVLVEDAYGLTPGERHLLHATRPIRDPLDVLESKIRGGADTPESQGESERHLLLEGQYGA
jgi:hypothetical protein